MIIQRNIFSCLSATGIKSSPATGSGKRTAAYLKLPFSGNHTYKSIFKRLLKAGTVTVAVSLIGLPCSPSLFAQQATPTSDTGFVALAPDAIKRLDAVLDFVWTHHLAVGSVAIQQNGKLLYQRGLTPGAKSQKEPAAGAPKEHAAFVYTTGSISKMFTAVMVLQLVEAGKLSLNTPLSRYYPDLPKADSITIEMLLRHRSGLPDYTTDKMESMDPDSLFSSVHYDYSRLQTNLGWLVAPLEGAQDSILRMIQHGKTHFSPGSAFEYNNSGYWLLAAIIEKCTGRSFGSNLSTRITSKLGMRHTCTAEQIVRSRTGSLHLKTTDSYYYCGGWQSTTDLYLPNAKGAGNICATPQDLLVFMQGLYQGRLVSKKMLNLMADFYYKDSARPGQFGMGLERAFFTDHTLAVGHSGDTYYNHGTVLYFPDTGLGICCLLNGLFPQFDRNDMLDMLYKAARNEQLENPVIDQWLPEPGQIDALLGSYYCDKLKMTINVLKDCRTVILYPRGQDALATYWTAAFQVSQPKYDLNVRFHADQPGFQLIQHGKTYNFVKQAAIKKD